MSASILKQLISLLPILGAACLLGGCFGGAIQRVGSVTELKKGDPTYEGLVVLPPLLADRLKDAHIQNCSLYLGALTKDPEKFYLFRHFEYTGSNLASDMAAVADIMAPPGGGDWQHWEQVFFTPGNDIAREKVERKGAIIGLRPEREKIIAYTQLHAATWPGVLDAIRRGNIRNFTIYHGEIEPGRHMLFSHFEYVGDDFAADMATIGADEVTRVWWTYTDPLQIRLPTAKAGEQWSGIPEVQYVP